jgi:hypothetical protein
MPRLGRKGGRTRASVGSLLGDVGEIARSIYAALAEDDVVVWATPGADVFYIHAREMPEVSAEHVVGTYRMGASVADIEDDLIDLRKSRVSGAMIF